LEKKLASRVEQQCDFFSLTPLLLHRGGGFVLLVLFRSGIMPGGDFVQGILSGGFRPGDFVRGILSGGLCPFSMTRDW